jgi:drug/metabolite transporter (DMT)-like permease
VSRPGAGAPAPVAGTARHAGPGWTLLLLGISLFVVNAGVSRLVLSNGIGAVPLASVRIAGTALVLGLVLVLTGRGRSLRVSWRELPLLGVYGIAGVGLVQVSYFVALERMPIGLALLLEYLAPLLVALTARFVLRERVSGLLWPALGLSLGGLALALQLTGGGEGLDPLGVAAGLVAAASFAAYFLLGERLVRHRDPMSTTFWGFAIPAVLATAVSPWWGTLAEASRGTVELPAAVGGGSVSLLVLVAWVVLLGTLSPFAATTAALRYIPATTIAVVATLEPVGAAVLAWWWFGESLTVLQVLGFGLVLSGVTLALYARARATVPPLAVG